MKFLHTADWHIGSLRGLKVPFEAKLKRYLAYMRGVCELARKHGILFIVVAGDIFDHKNVKPKERDALLQVLLEYLDLEFLFINGNHDLLENDYSSLHFLKLLQDKGEMKHVHVAEIDPMGVMLDDVYFLLVPFTGDEKGYSKHIKKHLSKVPKDYGRGRKPLIVVGHEMIDGCSDDSGWVADHGVDIPNLNRVTYWAMGDIHKTQALSGMDNAWYPGSPAQMKYSESTKKGCLLVDTDNPTDPVFLRISHPDIKPLISLDEIPEDGEWPDAWIDLKTSKAVDLLPPQVVRMSPKIAVEGSIDESDAQDEEIEDLRQSVKNPYRGLSHFLQTRCHFSKKDAKEAEKLVRRIRG